MRLLGQGLLIAVGLLAIVAAVVGIQAVFPMAGRLLRIFAHPVILVGLVVCMALVRLGYPRRNQV